MTKKIINAIITVCLIWLCGSFLCMAAANLFIEAFGGAPLNLFNGLTIFAATQFIRYQLTETKKDE